MSSWKFLTCAFTHLHIHFFRIACDACVYVYFHIILCIEYVYFHIILCIAHVYVNFHIILCSVYAHCSMRIAGTETDTINVHTHTHTRTHTRMHSPLRMKSGYKHTATHTATPHTHAKMQWNKTFYSCLIPFLIPPPPLPPSFLQAEASFGEQLQLLRYENLLLFCIQRALKLL